MDNSRKTLLVVEDNDRERFAVTDSLRDSGYSVYGVATGEEALEYLHKKPKIDLVLADLHIGKGIGGLDLISQWRDAKPKTPFIIMTGDREPTNGSEAIKTGAVDFIVKPLTHEGLERVVALALHH